MTINFGTLPVRGTLTLSSDTDFYQQVTTDDSANYPATASMTIKVYSAAGLVLDTWLATIATNLATFNEDKVDVALVLAASPDHGRVFYQDGAGGPELLLARCDIHDVSP